MTTLRINREQFDLIVSCVDESTSNDMAYIADHGQKRAGENNVTAAKEKLHLSNLFEVYTNGNGTKITHIEIVE